MEFSILSSMVVLLQLICVIIVVAYLLTRSRIFPEVLDGHPSLKTQVILILVFGALSVYGTISGVEFMGAIVNVRDLGPMLAGLLGGPLVGVGAGLLYFTPIGPIRAEIAVPAVRLPIPTIRTARRPCGPTSSTWRPRWRRITPISGRWRM